MDIGRKIKTIRECQNISMNSLAKKCEVSQANLSRIESGRQQPAVDTLERIITALGYTFVDFFSADQPGLEPELKRLVDTARRLKPGQLRALQAFLEQMAD